MALIRRHDSDLFPSLGRFFDDFFNSSFPDLAKRDFNAEGSTMPAVNVRETDDTFELEVATPGMQKDDFNVEVNDSIMSISGEKKVSNEDQDDNYTRREFSYQSFRREFALPENVDGEKIHAKYDDGILRITLPKKASTKTEPTKRIEIG